MLRNDFIGCRYSYRISTFENYYKNFFFSSLEKYFHLMLA